MSMSVIDLEASVWPATARRSPAGVLTLGGIDVRDLAAEFGTPAYILDEQDFRDRCQSWRDAFAGADVYYAAKAFLCTEIARWIADEGLGMDVCTGGELAVASRVSFPADRLTFHGNNKSLTELERALAYGVGRVVVDSFEEIVRLAALAERRGVRQKVLIRATPGVEAHTHEFVQTGQEDQKFGFSLAAHRMVGLLAEVRDEHGLELPELDLGGGTGIAYTSADDPMPVKEFADGLRAIVERECAAASLALPRIAVEPGRAISGPTTVTLYEVGTVKDLPGLRTYVSVDGGMSDNIRTALYDARYTAVLASRQSTADPRNVTLCGKHCESGDIVVHDVPLPGDLAPGDLVAVPASGAYHRSMASNYNHVPRPPVVGVRDGVVATLIRRETIEDLLALDVG